MSNTIERWYYIGPAQSFKEEIQNQIEACKEHNTPWIFNRNELELVINNKISIKHINRIEQVRGTMGNYHFLYGASTLEDYDAIVEEVEMRRFLYEKRHGRD